jgi:uncharacterized protein YlxW (UPF0749 family)
MMFFGRHELKLLKEITDTRDDLSAMAHRITTLANLIQQYEGHTDDENIQSRLRGMTTFVGPVSI